MKWTMALLKTLMTGVTTSLLRSPASSPMKRTPIQKRVLTWPEVTVLLLHETSTIWIPPRFPTRRWGNIYTLTSTTDKGMVERLVQELANHGYKVKKKKDKEKTLQHKNLGIFYSIEIQESIQQVDQLD